MNWKPIRRGPIYCSPACGYHCTFAAYQLAHRQAKALAKRLGRGWTTSVRENLGWQWLVVSPCRRIQVSKTNAGYRAMLGGWVSYSNDTPENAVICVIATAKKALAELQAQLKGL